MKIKIKTKLGDYLNNRGLKQKWLADHIGANYTQMSNWCKNDKNGYAISQPSVGYVLKIIKTLDCSINDLWELVE